MKNYLKSFILMMALSFTTTIINAQLVSTYAGSGVNGLTNGVGTAASFYGPWDVAVDDSGNVYVADIFNHVIRKITTSRLVSTYAGTGSPGSNNGPAATASFNSPQGVAVDRNGNVYVADRGNHLIRKITPSGMVSTLAGTGSIGSNDGIGTAASFSRPTGIAVDYDGNVYVADNTNHLIRKITPLGVVSTLAGSGSVGSANGIGTAASFNNPYEVAVDNIGKVYVADTYNYLIRKITPLSVVSTLAGSGNYGSSNGIGTAASFSNVNDLDVNDSGDVFVADYNNNLIRKITAAGVVSTYAGSGNAGALNGDVTVAGFTQPTGIAVDSIGNIYVADQGNGLIRKISKAWPVGLSHHSVLKSDLVVYPNPTQEQFSIQGTFHATVKLGVNVLDLQGRVMQQSTYEAHKGDNIFSLSLSNLPAAHYIIQFTEDGIHTRCSNIVKQ